MEGFFRATVLHADTRAQNSHHKIAATTVAASGLATIPLQKSQGSPCTPTVAIARSPTRPQNPGRGIEREKKKETSAKERGRGWTGPSGGNKEKGMSAIHTFSTVLDDVGWEPQPAPREQEEDPPRQGQPPPQTERKKQKTMSE